MPARYYVANTTGGHDGPFEIEEVRRRVTAGEITGQTYVCVEGGQQWVALSSVPELAPAPAAAPMGAAPPPPYIAGAGLPKASYVAPIIFTVLCCVIGGVISIVYTAKANSALAVGNVPEYEKAMSGRKVWLIVSVVVGLIFSVIQIVVVVAEMNSSGW